MIKKMVVSLIGVLLCGGFVLLAMDEKKNNPTVINHANEFDKIVQGRDAYRGKKNIGWEDFMPRRSRLDQPLIPTADKNSHSDIKK